jgi:hypothetical protein
MSTRPALPLAQAVLGLTIFASIALPLTPAGWSLLGLVLRAFRDGPAAGLVFLAMFASPQLFGLAVAIGGWHRDERVVLALVQGPIVILQGMIVLGALSTLGNPHAVAPLGFLGFAVTTGGYLVYASAEAAASERGPLGLRWYARWGALLVAGLAGWLRLQSLGVLHLGVAVDVAGVAAALLAWRLRRPDPTGAVVPA